MSNVKKATLIGTLLIVSLALSGCHRGIHRMMERMHERGMMGEHFGEMREFGRGMMPFGRGGKDERGVEMMMGVTHVFDKTDDGGIYQLLAEDADDAETIAMIQERLSRMAEEVDAEDADSDDADSDDADSGDADSGDADSDEEHAHQRGKRGERMGRQGMRGMFSRGMGDMMDEITITYSDLEDGGQVTISSENPEVVEMIHTWIENGPMRRGMRDGDGQR